MTENVTDNREVFAWPSAPGGHDVILPPPYEAGSADTAAEPDGATEDAPTGDGVTGPPPPPDAAAGDGGPSDTSD